MTASAAHRRARPWAGSGHGGPALDTAGAVLRWWHVEGITTADLTTRLGVIRGTSIPTLGDDEPVPDEREMWAMAWALCLIGRPQYAACRS